MPRTTLLAALTAPCLAAAALAGPLTPPAGPVAPTMKTLDQVEHRIPISSATTPGDNDATPSVYKITQAGSYYLTGDVAGSAGKIGIEIALMTMGSVTIDLGGHELIGFGGSASGVDITLFSAPTVIIRNGGVRLWGGDGIDLASAGVAVIENVTSRNNAGSGIVASYATVRSCTASYNSVAGFRVGGGSTVSNCAARDNVTDGFYAYTACTITDCTSYSNGGAGIVAEYDAIVARNTCSQNTGDGIRVHSQCRVEGNMCGSSGYGASNGAGVHAIGNDNRIEGNTVTNGDRGIEVDTFGNLVIRNSASGPFPYDVAAGNALGPVVTGGNLATNTNPHANYDF